MRGKVEEQNPQRFTDLISVFQKGMWDLLDDFIRQRKGKKKKGQALVVFKSRAAYFQRM